MYGIHPLGAGRGTHHVGEAHEELRNTILKTNSTFNNNSWRGPEVTSMRSSRPAGSRRAPCACRRRERERRGEEIIQPISCSRSPFVPFNF